MKRMMLLIGGLGLLASGLVARAGESHPYDVTAEAERSPGGVVVSTKITKRTPDGRTEVLSAPRLTLLDGRRGTITMGSETAQAVKEAGPGAEKAGDESNIEILFTGLQVDVIKPVGRDEVLLVTTITEKGSIVWADSRLVKVRDGKPSGAPAEAIGPKAVNPEAGSSKGGSK